MMSARDRITITLSIIGTIILALVCGMTVMMAAFTDTKNATTTLQFAEGVTLEATAGISSNVWTLYSGSNTNNINPVTFNNITLKCVSGAAAKTVYVRMFIAVWSDANATYAPLQNVGTITSGSGWSSSQNGGGSGLLANTSSESQFLNTDLSSFSNKKSCVITTTFTANNQTKSFFSNKYTPFTASQFTDAGTYLTGKFIRALVVISATNENPSSISGGWGAVNSVRYYTTYGANFS